MRALFLLLVIGAAMAGASYAAARFTAGTVVGPRPDLGPLTTKFAVAGVSALADKPRAWVLTYPEASEFGPGGAQIYVSVTGELLGTRPSDLAERMEAQRSADP
ncbi:MAG: hypothetical protein ACREMZ_06830 [Gemmatimonadales bacterium]